ncbi:hypothetical protein HK096_000773 [Nowakowskiella sp. JEL0078]|nr:hypothetical protein HK096_000773 [Nowakowskiella sp. JEL0078]
MSERINATIVNSPSNNIASSHDTSTNETEESKTERSLSTDEQNIDFEDLEHCHRQFLDNVTRGCFLNIPKNQSLTTDSGQAETKKSISVGILVAELLDCCERFCGIMERSIGETDANLDGETVFAAVDSEEILEMGRDYEAKMDFFFDVVANVAGSEIDQEVAEFLGRLVNVLDFNRWLSIGKAVDKV